MANFEDSLNSHYEAWVLRDRDGDLLGYFLLMAVVDEAHLLNVAVSARSRGRAGPVPAESGRGVRARAGHGIGAAGSAAVEHAGAGDLRALWI
jgi:hypothetical protein